MPTTMRCVKSTSHKNSTKIIKRSIKMTNTKDKNGKTITSIKVSTFFGPKSGAMNV